MDNGYITGDAGHNGQILEGLDYTPSVSLGQETFANAFTDLQNIGLIDESLNADEFISKATASLDGVSDVLYYDPKKKSFSEEETKTSGESDDVKVSDANKVSSQNAKPRAALNSPAMTTEYSKSKGGCCD